MFSHRPSKLPALRVADWGFNVTICIAAMAEGGKKFALVTDGKVAFGQFSADGALTKAFPIVRRNVVLMAGNDVARAGTVFNKAKARLTSCDADAIAETLFEECNAERDRIIEASVLRRRGFNWKMFRENGKSLCTDAVYYEIEAEIAEAKLSLDFMIAGFDDNNKPHIRYTNWHTPPENYDSLGFYAIGSGAPAAISSLAHAVEYMRFDRQRSAPEVVYHVLAAKFMSESAQDVGKKHTFLTVCGLGDKDIVFFPVFTGVGFVRERWEKEGAPRVPKGVTEAIGELLVEPKDMAGLEALRRSAKYSPQAKKILRHFEKEYEAYKAKQLASQKSEPEQ